MEGWRTLPLPGLHLKAPVFILSTDGSIPCTYIIKPYLNHIYSSSDHFLFTLPACFIEVKDLSPLFLGLKLFSPATDMRYTICFDDASNWSSPCLKWWI